MPQEKSVKLVLLPGMDGTGLLFRPLIEELPDFIEPIVVTYPTQKKFSSANLVNQIKAQLPEEPFILLAESFGGWISYQLALDKSLPIEKMILIASFISNPNPQLLLWTKILPVTQLLKLPIPEFLVRRYCFEMATPPLLIKLFYQAVKGIPTSEMANRIKALHFLPKPNLQVDKPCLSIVASDDRLVKTTVSHKLASSFIKLKLINIEGPHFLVQSRPQQVSKQIIPFLLD